MRGQEIITILQDKRNEKDCFVKWWRKEEDFLDYDLVDRFMANFSGAEEIGGISLLNMDEMWEELKRIGGTRVVLLHDAGGDKVRWVHKGKNGITTEICPYTAETLMAIFDTETKGNPVDS